MFFLIVGTTYSAGGEGGSGSIPIRVWLLGSAGEGDSPHAHPQWLCGAGKHPCSHAIKKLKEIRLNQKDGAAPHSRKTLKQAENKPNIKVNKQFPLHAFVNREHIRFGRWRGERQHSMYIQVLEVGVG